jgi:DNA-directed RNA polymerase specialized sigma24 family protein
MTAAASGHKEAMDRLAPLVYEQLRKAAQKLLEGERAGHTLSATALAMADPEQIVAVDAAVRRLENEDPEAAAVVRLRFYAGLSVDQAAEAIGISARTAARLWSYGRATLYRELSDRW